MRIKTFSGTKARDRAELGDKVTDFIAENPEFEQAEVRVLQSSDQEFHCLTIVLLLNGASRRRRRSDG